MNENITQFGCATQARYTAHQILRGRVQQVLDELAVDLHVGHGDAEGVKAVLRRFVEDLSNCPWDHSDGGDVSVPERESLTSPWTQMW